MVTSLIQPQTKILQNIGDISLKFHVLVATKATNGMEISTSRIFWNFGDSLGYIDLFTHFSGNSQYFRSNIGQSRCLTYSKCQSFSQTLVKAQVPLQKLAWFVNRGFEPQTKCL